MNKTMLHGREYLKAISQTLFFNHAFFGALIILLLFAFNQNLFLGGVFCSLVGYAHVARKSTPRLIKEGGLIPINGFFFGIAMLSHYQINSVLWVCLFLGAMAIPFVTKAIYGIVQHWKLSPYILPYLLTLWMISLAGSGSLTLVPQVWTSHAPYKIEQIGVLNSVFVSMGRLLYLPNPVVGVILLFLVSLFSWRRGLYFLLGTVAALAVSYGVGERTFLWENGFYSYSAGLIGLGLASFPEKFNWQTILGFCGFSALISMASTHVFGNYNLEALGLPYVLTLWTALLSRVPSMNISWAPARARPEFFKSTHASQAEEMN